MKIAFHFALLLSVITFFGSCKKDEGKLPNISFKSGADYVSTDVSRPAGDTIAIGIIASKAEDADVLKKFNISDSVNGTSAVTVYDLELTGTDGDSFDYDFHVPVGGNHGETHKLTFTVTNRDGLTNQVSLTVTIQ